MAFQEKLIDALGSFATTFNSYRYIQAIKSAFITLMPVIIVGAFSVLISNMVLDPKNGLVDSICQCNTPFNYLFRCF
ncbi:hypothetical protein EKN68_07170, partial [Enterobacter hormaechei]